MSWMSDYIMWLNRNEFTIGSLWGQKFLEMLQKWRLIYCKCSGQQTAKCWLLLPDKDTEVVPVCTTTWWDHCCCDKKKESVCKCEELFVHQCRTLCATIRLQSHTDWIARKMCEYQWQCAICAKYLLGLEGAATCVCSHSTPTELGFFIIYVCIYISMFMDIHVKHYKDNHFTYEVIMTRKLWQVSCFSHCLSEAAALHCQWCGNDAARPTHPLN